MKNWTGVNLFSTITNCQLGRSHFSCVSLLIDNENKHATILQSLLNVSFHAVVGKIKYANLLCHLFNLSSEWLHKARNNSTRYEQ